MRRAALACALLGALVWPLAQASSTTPEPALRVLDKAPLVLAGTGFKRGEWVKVTVVTEPAQLWRWRRVSRFGTFVVRFDTFVDVCHGARSASAAGTRGSKVSLVLERPWERYCVEPGGAP